MRTIEQILADLQAIIAGATEPDATGNPEDRPLTDEEMARYEALEGELTTLQRSAEFRTRHTAYLTPNRSLVPGAQNTSQGPTEEERAFNAYLRTGIPNSDLQFRAQAEGTSSAGGYLVPQGFLAKITERLKAFGGIYGEAEKVDTGTGNPLPWPTNDDTANSGEIVAENAAPAGGADLVVGQKTLGAYKYTSEGTGGLPLLVPFELAQDSAFDLESFVQKKLSTRIGRKQAADWSQGTGTGMPLGLLAGGTSGVTIATNATGMTFAEIVTAIHVPDIAYREENENVWVMHDSILALFERLVDSTGRPLLQSQDVGISGAPPAQTIRGYRVVVDNTMPSTFGVAAKTVVFGNVKMGYIIRTVKEITMLVFREMYAKNGQIGYMAWARADGTVQDANAYTVIRGA